MINTKTYVIMVVIAVVFGGAGFFGGIKYQQSKAPVTAGQFGGASGFQRGNNSALRRNANGSEFMSGQILSKGDKGITIQLPNNGGSKIVFLSAGAQIGKFDQASSTDLSVGQNVIVTGTANQDGSLTAQNVQIRPQPPAGQPPQNGQ